MFSKRQTSPGARAVQLQPLMDAANDPLQMSRNLIFTVMVIMPFVATEMVLANDAQQPAVGQVVLKSERFKHYIDSFNVNDQELYLGYITNGAAWNFLKNNVPLFECPDKDIETTYYFRW